MSDTLESATTPRITSRPGPALWRLAGGLAIAHVVLVFGGFSLERATVLGASVTDARDAYVDSNLARVMAGGYIEAFSFVLLLPVLAFLFRTVGRRNDVGRWASQTSLAAGLCYVAITLATGLPALGAVVYGGHHGGDLRTTLMVTDIRNFAFFLSLLVLGLQAATLGIAARADGFSPRWVGIGGIVVGILLALGVAGAGQGLHDYASMLWMIWWVGVGVMMIRNASDAAGDARR
jgi:hypothetical protein